MKYLFIILILILLTPLNLKASEYLEGIYKEEVLTLGDTIVENTLNNFYPVLFIDIFKPYSKDAYKNEKFTYVVTKKYPKSISTILGIRLRLNVYCTQAN